MAPTQLDYVRLLLGLATALFLYFLTRFAVEVLTAVAYRAFLRDVRRLAARQAALERERRYDARGLAKTDPPAQGDRGDGGRGETDRP